MRSDALFQHSAFGIVIEGSDAALSLGAFPALPYGGSAGFGHEQPAGHLLVFQHPVGRVQIDLRQHVQDQRRGQKAGAYRRLVI